MSGVRVTRLRTRRALLAAGWRSLGEPSATKDRFYRWGRGDGPHVRRELCLIYDAREGRRLLTWSYWENRRVVPPAYGAGLREALLEFAEDPYT